MADHPQRNRSSVFEIFFIFLRLGLTSFGGPVAHLGYFREAFVERRKWFSDRDYADLVALCQFLPGPASSQVGMAVGLQRAGIFGLVAAWVAFTLPSAIVLVAFAYGMGSLTDAWGTGWLAGFKAAAVAVVAQAVIGMARSLAADAKRATITAAGFIAALLIPHPLTQIGVIVGGGVVGWRWLREHESDPPSTDQRTHPDAVNDSAITQSKSRRGGGNGGGGGNGSGNGSRLGGSGSRLGGVASLSILAAALIALPLIANANSSIYAQLADLYTRVGTLVFGGGHVVLPLLEAETVRVGLIDPDVFLAGYGAAQAVPGPLFTFAAFLGATTEGVGSPILGATIALVAIFLPAALLVIGVLPFWERLRKVRAVRWALSGVGAAVVGILAAVLYDPVFTSGITSPLTLALAVGIFVLLTKWRLPAWAAIAAAGIFGWVFLT